MSVFPASPTTGTVQTGFTDNGDGTLTLDPSTATAGTYIISHEIEDPDNGCDNVVLYESIEIQPLYSPIFTLINEVCADDADITLNLTTNPTNLPNGTTLDEVVEWYGDYVSDATTATDAQ